MRKILFAVLAAVASAATHKNKLVSWENSDVLFADADPATKFSLSYSADFDFGYAVTNDQEPAAGDMIVDNWIQFELWSEANIGFNLNLFGFHVCQVNVAIEPFKIVPLWFSLYNTHLY
jgi:hypothetical protein